MVQFILVGLGAGLAAALLFMSPLGGTPLAFPLFALCGLPLAIAGLGWSPLAAIVGAAAAAGIILAFFTWPAAAIHVLLFGGPVAWLVRLAALSRRDGEDGAVEWYPLGRLLMQAAAAMSVGLVLVGLMVGFDPEELTAELTQAFVAWLSQSPGAVNPPTAADVEPFARLNVALLPFTLSALLLIILVFNMWLGSRVAAASGRMQRPRQQVWTAALPREAVIAFVAGLVLSFIPGGLGHAAAVVTGAFGAAFALVGLAVIHATTLALNLRVLVLVTVYVVIVLFGFPIVLLAAVGLAESFLHLRARRFGGAPPPPT